MSFLGDAKSPLGDFMSSLGDAKSPLGDFVSSQRARWKGPAFKPLPLRLADAIPVAWLVPAARPPGELDSSAEVDTRVQKYSLLDAGNTQICTQVAMNAMVLQFVTNVPTFTTWLPIMSNELMQVRRGARVIPRSSPLRERMDAPS